VSAAQHRDDACEIEDLGSFIRYGLCRNGLVHNRRGRRRGCRLRYVRRGYRGHRLGTHGFDPFGFGLLDDRFHSRRIRIVLDRHVRLEAAVVEESLSSERRYIERKR